MCVQFSHLSRDKGQQEFLFQHGNEPAVNADIFLASRQVVSASEWVSVRHQKLWCLQFALRPFFREIATSPSCSNWLIRHVTSSNTDSYGKSDNGAGSFQSIVTWLSVSKTSFGLMFGLVDILQLVTACGACTLTALHTSQFTTDTLNLLSFLQSLLAVSW
jgi:hypothetical protein